MIKPKLRDFSVALARNIGIEESVVVMCLHEMCMRSRRPDLKDIYFDQDFFYIPFAWLKEYLVDKEDLFCEAALRRIVRDVQFYDVIKTKQLLGYSDPHCAINYKVFPKLCKR